MRLGLAERCGFFSVRLLGFESQLVVIAFGGGRHRICVKSHDAHFAVNLVVCGEPVRCLDDSRMLPSPHHLRVSRYSVVRYAPFTFRPRKTLQKRSKKGTTTIATLRVSLIRKPSRFASASSVIITTTPCSTFIK